jgi:two-component system, chemotaxis family, protein-glutamate methylesterase/glutaminase
MNGKTIKVLVVEDSKAARILLVHILRSDPQIQVIGSVPNGRRAIEFLAHATPDVILMDIEMPKMNGFDATRRIMEIHPAPIVICSVSSSPRETATTFRSLEAGAVACIEKPVGVGHADFTRIASQLLETVKLMSEVKVVRRWPRTQCQTARHPSPLPLLVKPSMAPIAMIGIGASTGGPPVLETILAGLSRDFPAPLLVVQHITRGFVQGLASWLSQATDKEVHVAEPGVKPVPSHVYLAPDDVHMSVLANGRIALTHDRPDNGLRPSVAHLFDSLADAYGPRAIGVLLTGMGKDGANELGRLRTCGAVTIAQDRETSAVHGMPGEAIALGAATWVLPAERIGPALVSLTRQHSLSGESHVYSGATA